MKKLLIICISLVYIYAKEPIVLNVAIPQYSTTTKQSFETIAKDYEKLNPNVKVNIITGLWKDWQFKIQKDFFSGKNADIIYTTRAWLPSYVSTNKIVDLEKYLNKEDLKKFDKNLLKANKIDGKLYALPSVTSTRNLYINLDILKEAGERIPKTWEQLKEVAININKKTNKYAFGIQGDEVEMEKYFYYILWNFNGSILNKSINGTKSMLNTKEALDALTYYLELVENNLTQEDVSNSSREDIEDLFLHGRLAMIITYGKLANEIKSGGYKFNFMQTSVPSNDINKKGITLGVIDSVHISKNSKHKKEAAKFLMFTMKNKYQEDWIYKANLLPVTKSAYKIDLFQSNNLKAMIKEIPNAKFSFVHKKSIRIIDILKNMLKSVYELRKEPKDALKIAHRKISRILRR